MDCLKNEESCFKCNCLGSFTSDGFVIAFPRYSPFSSLSCIAVCFLRTRTNVVPIKFSINIGQNLFPDRNIVSYPCLPCQTSPFFEAQWKTQLSCKVVLARTPLRSFLLLNHCCPRAWAAHAGRSRDGSLGQSLRPCILLDSFPKCLQKGNMASCRSLVIQATSFWSSLWKSQLFGCQEPTLHLRLIKTLG